MVPQPHACNACQLSHTRSLASSAFARHYSRNHYCFLFLWVLRCFTSPRSLQLPYTFRQRSLHMTGDIRGFPIRRPPDHSSFTNSPGLIAGYNVLHRLLVPRHPPIALSSFHKKQTRKSTKMLASTMKISKHKQPPQPDPPPTGATRMQPCHKTPPHTRVRPRPQDPTVRHAPTRNQSLSQDSQCSTQKNPYRTPAATTTTDPPAQPHHHRPTGRHWRVNGLLRKEVIQPHLPVRLPCYDLVLITSPTFDDSLPKGLGRRLRVLPTFMT